MVGASAPTATVTTMFEGCSGDSGLVPLFAIVTFNEFLIADLPITGSGVATAVALTGPVGVVSAAQSFAGVGSVDRDVHTVATTGSPASIDAIVATDGSHLTWNVVDLPALTTAVFAVTV